MKWKNRMSKKGYALIAAALLAGCASMGGSDGVQVTLSGAQEVPPVNTTASGSGTVRVADDRSVTGSIRTQGVNGVAAHIHEGAAGQNGPVIVPMDKTGDNEWTIKPGSKLTESQYASYKAGNLYYNVHSPQNKGGEIRGQIRPSMGGARSGY